MHALWECIAANDVWSDSQSLVQKWRSTEHDFLLFWKKLMGRLNKKQLEEMAVLFRKVWFRRNAFVFEKSISCPTRLLKTAKEGLEEFQISQKIQRKEEQTPTTRINRMTWEKPKRGYVKVNWDASLDLRGKRMGMGIVIRDEEGEVLVAMCDQKHHVQNPTVAEGFALWKALELCNDLNIQKAMFEGDAKAVVMAVLSIEEDLSYGGSIVEDIRSVLANRPDWSIHFIYREKNSVAHMLAKEALKLEEEKVWIEEVPVCIVDCLDFDKHCLIKD